MHVQTNRATRLLVAMSVLALGLLAWGCGTPDKKAEGQRRKLTPADFAAAPGTRAPSPQAQAAAAPNATTVTDASPVAEQPDTKPEPQAVSPTTSGRFAPPAPLTADAMVGQVNGRAIYASQVIAPIAPQLRSLGQSVSRAEFRRQADNLIRGELLRIITDALILGEAERDLTQQEHYGILAMLSVEREKLMNFYGEGSRSLAEQRIIEETGRTLEQAVDDKRAQLVVQRYMQLKLYPKINVTRKDIRRYYEDHVNEFNPPVKRTIRLIVTTSTAAAEAVESALAGGKSFIEVARSRHNTYKPDQGGFFIEATGDVIFGDDRDEALRNLAAGQHSPRIDKGNRSYWIFVETLDQPPGISLSKAAPEIEQKLRVQRFQQLSEDYRTQLFAKGSYAPPEKMAAAVLDVAMSRYAPPLPQ